MIKRLKILVDTFAKITLGVSFAAAFYISVIWGLDVHISVKVLWEVLIVSAVCTIPILMFPVDGEKELSKNGMLLRRIIYFIFVNCVVLGLGWLFGWYYIEKPAMVAFMEFLIIFVYVTVNAVVYISENAEAKNMNKRLEEIKKNTRIEKIGQKEYFKI